jgi:replicative DNA helicase
MIGFGKFSQENVLTILVFDKDNCKFVSEIIDVSLFDAPFYRTIAKIAIQFIRDYGRPIESHIADELEAELTGPDSSTYREILNSLFTYKDSNYNAEYILNKLTEFVTDKKFITNIVTAHNLYVKGDRDKAIDVAKEAITFNYNLFDGGLTLDDIGSLIRSNDSRFPTGIEIFDRYGIGPARKQLYIFIAPTGMGKSWNLIHLSKIAIYAGYKVAYVTLELNQNSTYERFIQSIFSITTRRTGDIIRSAAFARNGIGDLIGINQIAVGDRPCIEDENIIQIVQSKLPILRGRTQNLRIKEYPTNGLSFNELVGYLDALERTQNFVPDILCVDYADLLKVDAENLRTELGQLYKSLRGLAVERNIAVATASQVNREGTKSGITRSTGIAEDWSKVATADCVIGYNQSEIEKTCHLARLYVNKSRSTRDNLTVLISQNYELGQFCLDSIYLPNNYNIDLANLEKGE